MYNWDMNTCEFRFANLVSFIYYHTVPVIQVVFTVLTIPESRVKLYSTVQCTVCVISLT